MLEARWRARFGDETSLGRPEHGALRAHARAFHDDSQAMARLAYSPTPGPLGLDDVATIMVHRVIAGWTSFVIDLNERVGLPFPQIDLTRDVVPN